MSSMIDRQLMSLYVTLLLSVACLGYAELGQELPETPFLYSFMFIALGAAYWAEGKFSLSIAASNALAIGLLLIGFGWIVMKLNANSQVIEAGNGMIRAVVSFSGPILCALLLAKLFRPKSTTDQWLLQLLGLVQVILASVLAMSSRMDRDAPLFPVLMLMYLGSLAWAIRLFYLRGEVDQTSRTLNRSTAPTLGWFSLVPVGWFLTSLLIAIIIFFCLPQGGIDASLLQGNDTTESGNTSQIDMNADGAVKISEERVMRIEARNKKGPVRLPESLRLRGAILSIYNDGAGVWGPFPAALGVPQEVKNNPSEIADDTVRMDFNIDVAQIQELGQPRQARFSASYTVPLFLADPPVSSQLTARYFNTPTRGRSFTTISINAFEGQTWLSLPNKVQTITVTHDYTGRFNASEWEQTLRFVPPEYNNYLRALDRKPSRIDKSKRIENYAKEVLEKEKVSNASDREKARALERHLTTGAFTYSLNRKKQDTSIDPTEDFLLNVKEGHCERYASALAIMLRTIGIKSRIIIGYRGLEYDELGGYHVVRQLHAHAWVEALVEMDTLADGSRRLQWAVLDPTPMNESRSGDSSFTSPLSFARYLWEFFILDFSGQAQRNKLMLQLQHTSIGRFFSWWLSLETWQALSLLVAIVATITVMIWLLVRWIRKRRLRLEQLQLTSRIAVPFYSRLLHLLSSRGWLPHVSQTPAEFADQVELQLRAEEKNNIAGIPRQLVSPYYAVRYGGSQLDQQQSMDLEQQLRTLQLGLKSTH